MCSKLGYNFQVNSFIFLEMQLKFHFTRQKGHLSKHFKLLSMIRLFKRMSPVNEVFLTSGARIM